MLKSVKHVLILGAMAMAPFLSSASESEVSDRVYMNDEYRSVVITNSTNFEYDCTAELDGLKFEYLVDTNFSQPGERDARIAIKTPPALANTYIELGLIPAGTKVVGVEQRVLSVGRSRCGGCDIAIDTGNSYNKSDLRKTATFRITGLTDQKLDFTWTMFGYDDNGQETNMGSIAGVCNPIQK